LRKSTQKSFLLHLKFNLGSPLICFKRIKNLAPKSENVAL
jgi:hypothetical protein